jgi:hypothetical protein
MLKHYSNRCLSIETDDEKHTTFQVDFSAHQSPYWKALQRRESFHSVIVVYGADEGDAVVERQSMKKAVSEIARAIKIHNGGIEVIRFVHCCVTGLQQLRDAVARINKTSYHRISFKFSSCRFEGDAVENIQLMLQNDMLESLYFYDCAFNDGTITLSEAIRASRGLKTFEYYSHRASSLDFSAGVYDMLKSNRKLVKLGLTIETDESNICLWEIFRSSKDSQTLQSLEIGGLRHKLTLRSVEAILLMCFMINSLQELRFNMCTFDEDALKFLIEALSNNKLINTLTLDYAMLSNEDHGQPLITFSCGKVQVESLHLSRTSFAEEAFLQTMTDMANKACVKSFHLGGVMRNSEYSFQAVCNIFLLPNCGPSELTIDDELFDTKATPAMAAMLTAALQHNTSVKALHIPSIRGAELVAFAQNLTNMNGIRQLSMKIDNDDAEQTAEQLFEALHQSLQHNTTLCNLSINVVDSTHDTKGRLPRICYLLATNLVGRHTLMAAPNIPVGLWAHVLARSCRAADGIYFALTEKPDIIMEASLMT